MSSASNSSQRFEEAHFTFALTPQQVQQILTSRYSILRSFRLLLAWLPLASALSSLCPVRLPPALALPLVLLYVSSLSSGHLTSMSLPSEGHTLTPLPLPPCYREVLPGAKCDYTIQVQLR